MGGVMGGIYAACDWIWKMALINILWILFTLAGLIVFGISPATVALFTVVRKWNLKETDIPVFRTFFETYKKEFLKANRTGLLMAAIGFFLVFDFKLVLAMGGTVQYILSIPLFIIIILYFITLLYLFPVYVHYESKPLQYIKNAFYIGILNMHITILMAAVLLLVSFPLSAFPGLLPFFSISVISMVIMFGARLSFQRIEKNKRNLERKMETSQTARDENV